MTELNDFFERFPHLRGTDPDEIREALLDRAEFDRLLELPASELRKEAGDVSALRARILAARQREIEAEARPSGSFLATSKGWLAFRFADLAKLAAGVVVAGSDEFFGRVLHAAAGAAGVMEAGSLAVERVDPLLGNLDPERDCTISTIVPIGVQTSDDGTLRLVGTTGFDFVFDEDKAVALEGGIALLCYVGPDGIDERCIRAPLRREGTQVIATFDTPLHNVRGVPTKQHTRMRYRLIPPSEMARNLSEV